MDDEPPDGQPGLCPVALKDHTTFGSGFATLAQPISDYSFANVFIWTSALKLYWMRLRRHVCLFANGTGDLTMLVPPLPEPGATPRSLRLCLGEAFEIMDAYNEAHSGCNRSRLEYVSDEMLERVNSVCGRSLRLSAGPMSGDYVYPAGNMIDLPGGALKSKRQLRTRFMREHPDHRVEKLGDKHAAGCLELLAEWRRRADEQHDGQMTEDDLHFSTEVLRRRETSACELALAHRAELGLEGIVVLDGEKLIGFTLGERLSPAQASILIEKTHPDYTGCPQFIFSEFCRRTWADYPEINVGDDWGIPTLRWTKESYRPSRRLNKYMLIRPVPAPTLFSLPPERRSGTRPKERPESRDHTPVPAEPASAAGAPDETATERTPVADSAGTSAIGRSHVRIRPATPADLSELSALEQTCFEPHDAFPRRLLRDLIRNERAIFLVAEVDGLLAGCCIALVRRHRRHVSGRIYDVAVNPVFRGRGLGSMLTRHALEGLRARRVRRVYLEVRTDNDVAIRLYRNLGFQLARPLPDYYGGGIHGQSMRLTLGSPEEALLFAPRPEDEAEMRPWCG